MARKVREVGEGVGRWVCLVGERIEEYRGWQEFRLNLNQFIRTDGGITTWRSKGGGVLKEGGRGLLLELQCTSKR